MNCLRNNREDISKCRDETREYLQCRMDHNLMAKEEWSYLGFKDGDDTKPAAAAAKPTDSK